MIGLLILIVLGYSNSRIARAKGQNVLIWILITIVAFLIGQMIGGMVVLFFFNKGVVNMDALSNGQGNVDEFKQQLTALLSDPVHSLLILACGIGGFLAIRYILERMPNKNSRNGNHINQYVDTTDQE